MRAVLINPFDKSVTEVDYSGDYRDIYKLIDCQVFTVANDGDNDIFVDDEGLLKEDLTKQRFFWVAGMEQPLAGKGLVLSCDADGETVATTTDVETISNRIRWYTAHELLGLAA